MCEWVLDRIGELVLKPVDGSGGKGIVIGPVATDAELAELRDKVLADPRGWIAQEPVALSTAPTFVDGGMGPRHLDLRPFAVNDGRDVWVAPGGLTRVALPAESLIVNSSQGGGSKDTWVLAAADHGREVSPPVARPAATVNAAWSPRRSSGRCPNRTRSSNNSSSSSRATEDGHGASRRERRRTGYGTSGRDRRTGRAEPHRRVALLDRALRGARRGHRAPARRALPPVARGPSSRRIVGVSRPARRDGCRRERCR